MSDQLNRVCCQHCGAPSEWAGDNVQRLNDLLNAVGHVGVDFGYGSYELSQEDIETAQHLFQPMENEK